MNHIKLLTVFLSLSFLVQAQKSDYDLTLIGHAEYADGLGRIGLGIIYSMKDTLRINHIPLSGFKGEHYEHIPLDILPILSAPDKSAGKVACLYYPVWQHGVDISEYVPQKSLIKLAYSMIESTQIPSQWVSILNKKFDAVVVPDNYYISVYRSSGVTIPIFALPHGLYLEKFLNTPMNTSVKKPFCFGSSGFFCDRKNQALLVEAFLEEFEDEPNAELLLHGRNGHEHYIKKIKSKIKQASSSQIKVIQGVVNEDEYLEFIRSLDCYVLFSKGEGFSVTPREAIALGIPTIVSNNTAHQTLCKSGFFKQVTSDIPNRADYDFLGYSTCGNTFNCSLKDARRALRDVYENYAHYKENAKKGREWVKQYLWGRLKTKFSTLFKPKKVILGSDNRIEDDYLVTNSKKLYEKYRQLNGIFGISSQDSCHTKVSKGCLKGE